MSSIFSTQNRHTFLRRKNCFFWVATALSPPVGRCAALPGLPLNSGMVYSSFGKPGTAAASVVWCAGGRGAGPAGGGPRRRRCPRRGHPLGRPLVALLLALLQPL